MRRGSPLLVKIRRYLRCMADHPVAPTSRSSLVVGSPLERSGHADRPACRATHRLSALKAGVVGILCLLTAGACTKQGETKKLEQYAWVDNTCSHVGTFDGAKYTRSQITGAHSLLKHIWLFRTFDYPVGDTIADASAFLNELEAEYNRHRKSYDSLPLPQTPIWKEFRAIKLREIHALYRIEHLAARAFSAPEVLDSFGIHDSCLDVHSLAMKRGGRLLLEDWKNLTKVLADRNGDPSGIWQTFHEKSRSSRRTAYAKADVMAYGWRTCALAGVPHLETLDSRGAGSEEFKKLFVSIESNCSQD